jgi:hypothetical protein
LILQFATARIIVVPINVQSDPIELHNENEDKDKDEDETNDEKIDHWDIWEEMIRISINNPLNWYSFNLNI